MTVARLGVLQAIEDHLNHTGLIVDIDLLDNKISTWQGHSRPYVLNFVMANAVKCDDGFFRIYPTWIADHAKTGRWGCRQPNMHCWPHGCREIIKASPNTLMATIDWRQMEMRVAAYVSDCKALIDIIYSNKDLYDEIAVEFHMTREEAKRYVLIWLYSPHQVNHTLSRRFPELHTFAIDTLKTALMVGQVETLDGTIVYVDPDILARGREQLEYDGKPDFSCRAMELLLTSHYSELTHIAGSAVAVRIQGTAADLLRRALLRIEKEGLASCLRGTWHDEILVEVDDHAKAVYCREIMESVWPGYLFDVQYREGSTWL